MEKKMVSYSCVCIANNIYSLEIVTPNGLMLFQGSLEDCEAQINYMNSKTK